MGGRHVVDHVAHDGSNRVAISAEIDDVEAMLAAIASPPPTTTRERHEADGRQIGPESVQQCLRPMP
jgi:hypothetical protein